MENSIKGTIRSIRAKIISFFSSIDSALLQRWIAFGMIIIFLISISTWLTTRDRIPETIRIAAAQKGGLYYKFAESIKPYLEKKTGMRVEVLATNGSMQNRQLLLDNKADLAVTTEEFLPQQSLYEITPLYNEVVHVVVRKSSSIYVMEDLKNKNISIGIKGSGMRSTAQKILDHYKVILNTSVLRKTILPH